MQTRGVGKRGRGHTLTGNLLRRLLCLAQKADPPTRTLTIYLTLTLRQWMPWLVVGYFGRLGCSGLERLSVGSPGLGCCCGSEKLYWYRYIGWFEPLMMCVGSPLGQSECETININSYLLGRFNVGLRITADWGKGWAGAAAGLVRGYSKRKRRHFNTAAPSLPESNEFRDSTKNSTSLTAAVVSFYFILFSALNKKTACGGVRCIQLHLLHHTILYS